MINNSPCNEVFFSKLKVARDSDPLLNAACVKIERRLKDYANSRGIKPDELRLFDVCDAEGKLHPKVRAFIEKIPKLEKQTDTRYEEYKEEILSNIQRAINAVVTLITGVKVKGLSDTAEGEIPVLLRHEHLLLIELYDHLPRQASACKGKVGWQRGQKLTENSSLFYLSCAEALKCCSPSSLQGLLVENRKVLIEAFKVVCRASPEKAESLLNTLDYIHKRVGLKRIPKRKCLPVEEWPSPLREEMQVYQAVANGILIDGLEEKAARYDGKIELLNQIRPATVRIVQVAIEILLYKHCAGREKLGVRDLLSTTETEVVAADGKKPTKYFNEVLSPYREAEKARASKFKRAGRDSRSFEIALSSLLSLAAYNGIFEYHEIIKKAFKVKVDNDTTEQRKAEKKLIIKRQALDQWIEDNWAEYERILKQGLFKRDKSKRTHTDADRNMRFVLHYCRITTMKVMGFRQRQIRDCRRGVNIIITRDSVEFTYPLGTTKKKPLHFKADLENCSKTHSRLIHTLYLFDRYAFPYVQANLEPQKITDYKSDHEANSADQFFVHFGLHGTFKPFNPLVGSYFVNIFRLDCNRFLKHPELENEAAVMIHPHYLRGAAMDTQIEDNGMSNEAASRYFGISEQVINSKYKDRRATQDASRDVQLLNAQIEDLEARKKRNREDLSEDDVKRASQMEEDLRRQLREAEERAKQAYAREQQALERVSQKDAQIAKLERRLDKIETSQGMHHAEVMKAIRGGSNGQAAGKSRTKKM